jgi:hypothetical protein
VMASFYINGVSRALRSVQRVDLNYSIAAAVRTGDSQRRRTVTDSGFAGVSLVGPPPESESPLRAGRGGYPHASGGLTTIPGMRVGDAESTPRQPKGVAS